MSAFRSLLLAFSAAVIAGCGVPQALEPRGSTVPASSMAAAARYAYVSDTYANRVYVYAWSVSGMRRGAYIRSFHLTEPFGGCADNQGDVYITHLSNGNGELVEYRGDSGGRLRTLIDSGNVPFSCAVDPKTGNIAVANIGLAVTFGTHGSVWVYPSGSGPPVQFADLPSGGGTLQAMYFVAYDGSGKLYADGSVAPCYGFTICAPGGDAHVDVLPSCCSQSSTFVPVTLKGDPLVEIQYPGALVWDGKHLVVGDREAAPYISGPYCVEQSRGCGALYITVEGGSPSAPTLTEKALTLFNASAQAWGIAISDGKSVVPNMFGNTPYAAQVYRYPAGGAPVAGWDAPGSAQTPAFVVVSQPIK